MAKQGTSVSLALIARTAGVGAGTVHRHFPTKESLIEAVFAAQLHELASRAERRLGLSAPGDAFFALLTDTIESAGERARICDAFRDEGWPRTALAAAVLRFDEVLEEHLAAAQRSGHVCADVTPEEAKALVTGCVAMRTSGTGGTRMARSALEILCRMCGVALEMRPVGRPARYCGPTCRKRAQRRKNRTAAHDDFRRGNRVRPS